MQRESWVFTADKLNDYLRNPKSRPEFGDPNHPDYDVNKRFLDALEAAFHNENTDQLFPWFAKQYLRGELKHVPERHDDPRHEFMMARDPDEVAAEAHQMLRRYQEAGYDDEYIHRRLQTQGPLAWAHLDPDQVDQIGDWLGNTNSQHPTRKNFDIQQSNWEEMKQRAEEYKTWQRMRDSLKKAVYKSSDGKYHMYPLAPEDCAWEGDAMRNCIRGGGYGESIRQGNSLIYSLRNKAGVPKVDIEIKPTVAYNPKTKESMPIEEWRRQGRLGFDTCPDCRGNGVLVDVNGDLRRDEHGAYVPCETCGGAGRVQREINPEVADYAPSPVNGTVVQIQGKQNRPPIPRYHPYISEFFTKKFPDAMRPQWSPNIAGNYNDFRQVYRPGDAVYYHPGDYGLEKPNITNDWLGNPQDRAYSPGLVYSFANSSGGDDEHDKKGARHLYYWAHDLGQMDQLEGALQDEGVMNALKAQAGQHLNVRETPEFQQWVAQNPEPRNEVGEPQLYDEQGNDRYGTPEYQAEEQAFREANERYWLERQRWDDQHHQVQEQIRGQAGERYWPQTRQAQMLGWLNGFVSGNPPQIYDPEEEEDDNEAQAAQHHGKRLLESWCICGKCHVGWDMHRTANQKSEQAWRKVRNQLRKNNILTPENEAGWGNMSRVYSDHGHLGEWLHREYRKDRLKMGGDVSYHLQDLKRYQELLENTETSLAQAEAEGDENRVARIKRDMEVYRRQIETYKTTLARNYDTPMSVPGVGERNMYVDTTKLTPELMEALVEHIKRENQRDKDFNVMKQELPPLFDTVQKAEQQRRLLEGSGVPIHQFPNGWSIRYVNDPESAKMEGELMGHCIGRYGDRINLGTSVNHSLRDPEGFPHATWDYTGISKMPQIDWEATAGGESPERPGYCKSCGSDLRHMPRLCPKCQGPLTAKGECTKCGYQGMAECPMCAKRAEKLKQELDTHNSYDNLSYAASPDLKGFMQKARGQGHLLPDVSGASLGQIQHKGGGYGVSRLKQEYKDMIRGWVEHTWPNWEDRPSGESSRGTYIYHPDELNEGENPVDALGMKSGAQHLELNSAVQNMREPNVNDDVIDYANPNHDAPYDPARGQKLYDWAAAHNKTADLYTLLNKWEHQTETRPRCPQCRYTDDVRFEGEGPNGDGNWRCRYCARNFSAPSLNTRSTGPKYTPYQAAAVQHLGPLLAQHPELVQKATAPTCPSCHKTDYIVPQEDGTYWCRYCNYRFDKNMQRLGHSHDTRPIKHISPHGNICYCSWFDHHNVKWSASLDSDWGEDADSGQAIQPDHYPREKTPTNLLDRHGDPIPCPTCGDPLSDGYCKRCDWGGWVDGDPLKRFPEDAPIRDMKPAIQANA